MTRNSICILILLFLAMASKTIFADEDKAKEMKELQIRVKEAQKAFQVKDFPKAITLLKAILEKTPNPMFEYNLACAYAQIKNKHQALNHLEKAILLGYINVKHIENDPDLISIRTTPRYSEVIKKAKSMLEAQKKIIASIPSPKDILLKPKKLTVDQKIPLLVFLHGMGGSSKDLEPVFKILSSSNMYSVLLPCGSVKMGLRADGNPAYNWDPMKDSKRIIEKIKKMKGIQQDKIYLAGFSAGANMSYVIGVEAADQLKGVIAFSGAVQNELMNDKWIKKASNKLPIYIVHGLNDKMMPISLGRNAYDYFKKHDFHVKLKTFQGGHTLPSNYLDIIKDAVEWFHKKK
ncbi:MAG: hypothetical protein COA79_23230 [Planctomycetota bacterium]|nr:MAG: hypothetical protein COA79_23230 [Planctomycetota bacterium]